MKTQNENIPGESFLGSCLLSKGAVTPEDLQKAIVLQHRAGGRIDSLLLRTGAISEETLLESLSDIFKTPVIESGDIPADIREITKFIEHSGIEMDWWLDQEILAWKTHEGAIRCIMRRPLQTGVWEVMEKNWPERRIEYCLVRSGDLDRILDLVSKGDASGEAGDDQIEQLRELAEEAPVIEFVNNLLSRASDQNASDVHIEPGKTQLDIRFRIDGVLYQRFSLPTERFPAIASRIKLISGMDIAERRTPQDGRLGIRLSGREIDIRVSTVPGVYGESVVLRLLSKENREPDLESLGLEGPGLKQFEQWIHEPHGVILVTGPTGSGKSTTLYAALEKINDRQKKIITVEDPVEYRIEGVTQIQVHAEIGYTFARALRSILRHDPDVMLVGEIRDRETAEIAIQASLTGHLVFSTLHTNDALSAFTRLVDMGIEPFLIAAPVRAVMAQRLVRRLCPVCAKTASPVDDIRKAALKAVPNGENIPENWKNPAGCVECKGTGYRGREAIYELVDVTPGIQHLIIQRAGMHEMRTEIKKQGFRSIRENGLVKALKGVTSIEEVLRVTAQ